MSDTMQFFVTRVDENTFRVVAQDAERVVRANIVPAFKIMNKLRYELKQLRRTNV